MTDRRRQTEAARRGFAKKVEARDGAVETLVRVYGGLTARELGEIAGWTQDRSKDALERLRRRGLVEVVGKTEGRGRPAAVYDAVRPKGWEGAW